MREVSGSDKSERFAIFGGLCERSRFRLFRYFILFVPSRATLSMKKFYTRRTCVYRSCENSGTKLCWMVLETGRLSSTKTLAPCAFILFVHKARVFSITMNVIRYHISIANPYFLLERYGAILLHI